MDDENLLAVALACMLRRYVRLRTLAGDLPLEAFEVTFGPDEVSEAIDLVAVVRCDENGGLAVSLVQEPPEDGEGDDDDVHGEGAGKEP